MGEFKDRHNLKSIRQDFKKQGVFYTDSRLAVMLRDIVNPANEVYDPTCGSGNLLAVFPDTIRKYGQELDYKQAEIAQKRLTNAYIVGGNTLTDPYWPNCKFQSIVANYPFSIPWEPDKVKADDPRFKDAPCLPPPSKADFAFLMHIIYVLANPGTAAVLNFPGILYRGQREGKIRRWIVEKRIIESVTLIEGGYFADTSIATALIVFKKDFYPIDNIRFCDHQTGKEITVSVERVLANDANLTPSSYIPSETKPGMTLAEVRQLAIEAHERMSKHILADLNFEAGLQGIDPEKYNAIEYADELIRAIEEWKIKYRNGDGEGKG
jgi:hypothetical protein